MSGLTYLRVLRLARASISAARARLPLKGRSLTISTRATKAGYVTRGLGGSAHLRFTDEQTFTTD